MNRVAVTILAGPVLALALAACGGGGAGDPSTAPTDVGETSLPPTPTSSPIPADAELAGDCTEADADPAIPVVYTVYTGDATTPTTVTYTAFNADGTHPDVTETVTGPVWTKTGYACTTEAGSSVWTLTATQTTSDSLACVLAFGGQLVKTDSQYAEAVPPISITATCSGNPGM
jgi:hypothetical protein